MNDVTERLSNLFDGLSRGYGTYTLNGDVTAKGKLEGRGMTVTGSVTQRLWDKHISGEQSLGIVPIRDDDKVVFAAIDIDIYDLDLQALEHLIHKKQLPLIVCRTKSGGAHCYIFFKKPEKALPVRKLMASWAIELGHPGVEIFPKQDRLANETDIGNWLNMPYFNAEDTTRGALVVGEYISLENFIEYAEGNRVSLTELQDNPLTENEWLIDAPPCLNSMLLAGIGEGMRNDALLNLGVYARLKYEDWEPKLDQYNNEYLDPPLGHTEVAAIAKSLGKKKYFYTCARPPICNFCNKDACRKRKFGIGSGDDIGVLIESLTKIESIPPLWIAQVNGARIELTTEELMSQVKFQTKCISVLNYFPATIKSPMWKKLLNALLIEIRTIEAPPDAGPLGQLDFYVDHFCTEMPQGDTMDELLTGKPWTDNGVTWFRSTDLYEFLRRRNFREYTGTNLYIGLRKLSDIQHKQVHIMGKCVQVWGIPERAQQSSNHGVKRIEPDEDHF